MMIGGEGASVSPILPGFITFWQERDTAGRIVRKEHSGGVTQLSYTGTSTTPSTTLNYIVLSDHLGSRREVVRLNASQQAELVGRRDYDPYGQVFQVGQQPSPAAYTGHEYDSDSGLHLTWYRAYDARTGTWLSADPIGEEGGLNLYGYVGNGPLMAVDPFGLDRASKCTAAALNALNAGRLLASGFTKLGIGGAATATGVGAAPGVGTMALGYWNLNSANSAMNRSLTLASELKTDTPGWNTRNLLGVLPWGTEYDDPGEPSMLAVCKKKANNAWNKPWEFLQEIGTVFF